MLLYIFVAIILFKQLMYINLNPYEIKNAVKTIISYSFTKLLSKG